MGAGVGEGEGASVGVTSTGMAVGTGRSVGGAAGGGSLPPLMPQAIPTMSNKLVNKNRGREHLMASSFAC